VYILPKQLDEKVARLQLSKLDAMLTELTDEQAATSACEAGPYKSDHYSTEKTGQTTFSAKNVVCPDLDAHCDLRSGRRGGYFGARLQQAGHSVAFIAAGGICRRWQRNGPR